MNYVFDHHALQYMLEQFPRGIASELWDMFATGCEDGTIISHKEAQKLLEQEAVESSSLKWSSDHANLFKGTTASEAQLLGDMMRKRVFNFLETPRLLQRRIPEAIPFILCIAKKQDRYFVYRKNTNTDFMPKIKRVCTLYDIGAMEVEECLIRMKDARMA